MKESEWKKLVRNEWTRYVHKDSIILWYNDDHYNVYYIRLKVDRIKNTIFFNGYSWVDNRDIPPEKAGEIFINNIDKSVDGTLRTLVAYIRLVGWYREQNMSIKKAIKKSNS